MWIFLSRELWRWNQTVTPALRTAILSASLDTQKKKKKAYFLFHIIKVSLRYLSPSLWNQPTATATLSRHRTAVAYKRPEAPSRGHVVKPQGWGESLGPGPQLHPPTPHGMANSYLHCRNPHPLVQTHPRVPCQCRLTDSSCVGGLGAVYTECQAPARRLSVSARVAEWVVSDVGGWKWLGRAEEGGWGKLLPQESEPHLACGIWLPLRRAAAAAATTASAFSLRRWQTPIKPTLWEWSMMTLHVRPLPRDLNGLQILGWENGGPYTSSSTPPKTTTLQRWKQVFLAPLTAWSFF